MFRSSGLGIQYNLLVRSFLFVHCASLQPPCRKEDLEGQDLLDCNG